MKNTSFAITVPHQFSPISALSAESKSYIVALCFNVHETFQVNQSNSQTLNNDYVQLL